MHQKILLNKISKKKEPLTVEEFIDLCLYGNKGYYKTSNVIGRNGDFITAPEISQLFGEIIGLFILDYWKKNIKKSFNLLELGPGKGTLLLDILRITNHDEHFKKKVKIHLIEKNLNLIKKQKSTLEKLNVNFTKIKWSKDVNIKNKKPIIIFANEFFDCFSIRQFYKKQNKWNEKMINFNSADKCLKFKDVEVNDTNTINKINSYNPNSVLEISQTREKYFLKICKHIYSVGGMMMIIDYGYIKKPNKFTLQSLYNNKHSNVLENIGYQDITSLVDFNQFIKIAKKEKLKINSFNSQREFLIKYGIKERCRKISLKSSERQIDMLKNGLERIIDKNNMGSLFKVLIISK